MSVIRPKFSIGVNVFVIRDGKILLGKRKNTWGAGMWGMPGGHLENDEKMEATAARELMEEVGLTAKDFTFLNIINESGKGDEHYIQVGFLANGVQGEPSVHEPDICEEWRWFDLNTLPKNVLLPHARQIQLYKEGVPFGDF